MLGRAADNGTPVDGALLKPALEQASAQAQRAGQIIRSVHGFVKKREPRRQAVALPALLDGIRTLIELQARQRYVTFQTELPAGLPPVLADHVMIEQVLLNLTRNAIDAMQNVPPHQRLLTVVASHDAQANQVSVAVIDRGHGISEEVAQRLFSPFFSTKSEGMGMGLNICRTAIEFHGGALTYSANPQGGTIFTFVLPAAPVVATEEI